MKNKIYYYAILLSMFLGFSPRYFTKAVGCPFGTGTIPGGTLCLPPSANGGLAGATSASDLLIQVINLLLGFAALVAILFIIIGGYRYITAAGNEKSSAAGRKILTDAVIGLVIIILSFVIVRVVDTTISGGFSFGGLF